MCFKFWNTFREFKRNQNDFINWIDNHRILALEEVGDELDERFEIIFKKLLELEKRDAKYANNVLNEFKKTLITRLSSALRNSLI